MNLSREMLLASTMRTWSVLALLVLAVGESACRSKANRPATENEESPEGDPLTQGLARLKRRWIVPGAWTTQSMLGVEPQGRTLLALGPGVGQSPDLLAIDIETGKTIWQTPLAHKHDLAISAVGSHAIVYDTNNNLAAFDLRSGQSLWSTKTSCRIGPGQIAATGHDHARASCEYPEDPLDIDLRSGKVSKSEPVALAIDKPGDALQLWEAQQIEEKSRCDEFLPECFFQNHRHRVDHVERAGRSLQIECTQITELDPATGGKKNLWSLPQPVGCIFPSVMALDFVAHQLVVVLAGNSEKQPGRIAIYDQQRSLKIALAPGIDPELVVLRAGMLVVRRGSEGFPSMRNGPLQLEGYSAGELIPDRRSRPADLIRVRSAIQGRGSIDHTQRLQWGTKFDDAAVAELKAIPDWERHLAVLLDDPDDLLQAAATAAAVHLRSAIAARALMRLVETRPERHVSRWLGLLDDQEFDWWDTIAKKQEWSRELWVTALIQMSFDEAVPLLGRLLLEDPILGYDNGSRWVSLAQPICVFLRDSPLPQARAALVAYDERIGSPDAWRVLCDGS
jgi:hypothetical protein